MINKDGTVVVGQPGRSGRKTKAEELKAVRDLIEKLEIERQRAIDLMGDKAGKAKYRDLTDALDKLTKNIQLLGGKPTENVKFTDYGDDQRRKIADRILRGKPTSGTDGPRASDRVLDTDE